MVITRIDRQRLRDPGARVAWGIVNTDIVVLAEDISLRSREGLDDRKCNSIRSGRNNGSG